MAHRIVLLLLMLASSFGAGCYAYDGYYDGYYSRRGYYGRDYYYYGPRYGYYGSAYYGGAYYAPAYHYGRAYGPYDRTNVVYSAPPVNAAPPVNMAPMAPPVNMAPMAAPPAGNVTPVAPGAPIFGK